MKFRSVVIFSGQKFKVPQGIQRIDHRSTHGWQLRYGGQSKMFSDFSQDGTGAKVALALATEELMKRIQKQPAPSRLQTESSANKTSNLPVGISGPIVRKRPGQSVAEANLAVSLPRFGQTALRRSVYIANENTYTIERFQEALEKAVAMRDKAAKAYQAAATKAKRADALLLVAKK